MAAPRLKASSAIKDWAVSTTILRAAVIILSPPKTNPLRRCLFEGVRHIARSRTGRALFSDDRKLAASLKTRLLDVDGFPDPLLSQVFLKIVRGHVRVAQRMPVDAAVSYQDRIMAFDEVAHDARASRHVGDDPMDRDEA